MQITHSIHVHVLYSDSICKRGAVGDSLYFVKSGMVHCRSWCGVLPFALITVGVRLHLALTCVGVEYMAARSLSRARLPCSVSQACMVARQCLKACGGGWVYLFIHTTHQYESFIHIYSYISIPIYIYHIMIHIYLFTHTTHQYDLKPR